MENDKHIKASVDWMAKRIKLMKSASDWYGGDDPVVRSAVLGALEHLSRSTPVPESVQALRQAADKIVELLAATADWPDVRRASGAEYYDPDNGQWKDSDAPPVIDVVDHLMIVYPHRFWQDLPVELDDILMLLTLHEAKADRPGVAIKAFFVGASQRAEEGYRLWREHTRNAKETGRRVGRLRTRRIAIFEFTCQLVRSNPNVTAEQALAKFPELGHAEDVGDYEVYRDGERLIQRHQVTGKENSIKASTFRTDYLSDAKARVKKDLG